MSLEMITLPTNKSVTVVNNNIRTLRQSEKGLVLPVTLIDANGSAYDLTNKKIVFSENKEEGKVIIDDGSGEHSGQIQMIDEKAGRFDYILQADIYSASGEAWFEIVSGTTVVDTTKNFKFKVLKQANIHINNDNYVSTLEALENHFRGVTQKAEQDVIALSNDLRNTSNKAKQDAINAINEAKNNAINTLNQLRNQYTDYQTKYNNLQNEWNAQKQKIQQDADNQKAALKKAADDQRNADKAADDEARTNAINAVNSAKDSAIKAANDNFNKKLSDLQQDYDTWKTKTISDFNFKAKQITDSINAQNQNIDTVKQQLKDTQSQMSNLLKQFSSVDFNNFVKQVNLSPQNSAVNLFAGTNQKIEITGSGNGKWNSFDTYVLAKPKLEDFGIKVGDSVTLSFDWYAYDTTNTYTGTFNANEVNQEKYGWGGYSVPFKATGTLGNNDTHVSLNSNNKSGHVTMSFKVADKDMQWFKPKFRVRTDNVLTTTTITIEHFQAIKGDIAIPYKPAIEDLIDSNELSYRLNRHIFGFLPLENNLNNWNKSEAAKKCGNIFFNDFESSNTFDYLGVADFEVLEHEIDVIPNTSYRITFDFQSLTNMMTLKDQGASGYSDYIIAAVNSSETTNVGQINGDLGNVNVPVKTKKIQSFTLDFFSSNHSKVYFSFRLGSLADGVPMRFVIKKIALQTYQFTHENTYTKEEIDQKIATAGQVKRVQGVNPDPSGNVNLPQQTVTLGYDFINKKPTNESRAFSNYWMVDQQVLGQIADYIRKVSGVLGKDGIDANSLTDSGNYIVRPNNAANYPRQDWGVMIVDGSGNRVSQMYIPDTGEAIFWRFKTDNTWRPWKEIANADRVNLNGPLFHRAVAGNNWGDILGFGNNSQALVAFRGDTANAMNNLLGNYSAGVAFGGADTKGYLEVSYGDHTARIGGGNGNAPVWHEDIAWKSDITNLQNQLNSLRSQTKKTWIGTMDQYNAIGNKDGNTIYYITE